MSHRRPVVPRRPWRTVLAALLLALAPGAARADDDEPRCSDAAYRDLYGCRELIVRTGPGFDATAVAARHQLDLLGLLPQLRQAWFLAPIGSDLAALEAVLAAEPGVVSVERNNEFVLPECRQLNMPIVELAPVLPADLSEQPAIAVLSPPARGGDGAGVTVAVLDTGISRSHPALAGALANLAIDPLRGTSLADDTGNGLDEDGDGVTDGGWGHGTAVASLIHGVAPAARLLPVRVVDDECRGTAFALTAGIVQAVDAGAHVLNLSLGSHEENDAVEDALLYAVRHGVVVVAAAGNVLAGAGEVDELQFPADWAQAVAVAAVDNGLVAAPFTVHDEGVLLSAPGVDLLAAWRDGYARASGTSFSAALVSGAAAVALSARPGLAPGSLRDWMRSTAIPVDPWNPLDLVGQLGAGVPDLARLAASDGSLRRGSDGSGELERSDERFGTGTGGIEPGDSE